MSEEPRENFMYGNLGDEPMVNRELYRFTDDEGEEYFVVGPRHSITDVLNQLVNESGFAELEAVFDSIVQTAKEAGLYDGNR